MHRQDRPPRAALPELNRGVFDEKTEWIFARQARGSFVDDRHRDNSIISSAGKWHGPRTVFLPVTQDLECRVFRESIFFLRFLTAVVRTTSVFRSSCHRLSHNPRHPPFVS